MAVSLKRKLYSRGGSFETTVPMQLLFSLDMDKKHDVVFRFDKNSGKWYVEFEESNKDHSTQDKIRNGEITKAHKGLKS